MQTDEDRIALRVGNRCAIVKRWIRVASARYHHFKALLAQSVADDLREFEHQIFFRRSAWTARACVRASVRRIENDHAQYVRRRGGWRRRCGRLILRGRGNLYWSGLLGRNCLLGNRRRLRRLRLLRILRGKRGANAGSK